KTPFAKNRATVQQCRTREIVEGKRNHRRFHLDPAGPAAKPPRHPALGRGWDVMPEVHAETVEGLKRPETRGQTSDVSMSSDRTGVRCSIPVRFAAVNSITFGHSELQNCEITLVTCVIASSGISG